MSQIERQTSPATAVSKSPVLTGDCQSARRIAGMISTPCGITPNPISCHGCPEYTGLIPTDQGTSTQWTSTDQHEFVKQVLIYGAPTGD